jgi:phospholipase/carboxylesterase
LTDSETKRTTREGTLSAKIKLHYDLSLPEELPAPLLIALHGYGANKRQMMREALSMAPATFAIASLQGFHQHLKEPKEEGGPLRFGFGWLSNFHPEESVAIHHQALLDLRSSLVDQGIADRDRVFLLGFSQTCALNYRFAFTHPEELSGIIGICGGVPSDWETSVVYKPSKASVLHLAGAKDEFYPPSRVSDYERQLRMRAQDVEFTTHEAGHEIVASMREDVLGWLSKHAD